MLHIVVLGSSHGKEYNMQTRNETEAFATSKASALQAAIELGYDEDCKRQLRNADNMDRLNRIMINARKRRFG